MKLGRPPILVDSSVVVLDATTAVTRIQNASERRAVVNFLIECGGRATLYDINARFDYDTKNVVLALLRTGWVRIEK